MKYFENLASEKNNNANFVIGFYMKLSFPKLISDCKESNT